MQFTLTSSYNRFGCWGLTDDISNPYRNSKMQCIQDLIREHTVSAAESSVTTTVLNVFPNPCSDEVRISISDPEEARNGVIRVLGVDGREVYSTEVGAQDVIHLATKDFPKGLYFLTLTSERARAVGRLVVQRN